MNIKGYSQAIDMWSYGCILFELYTGEILFQCGDPYEHLSKIIEVRNVPPKKIIKSANVDTHKFFRKNDLAPLMTPDSKGKLRVPGSKNLREMLRTKDRDFVDFIDVS